MKVKPKKRATDKTPMRDLQVNKDEINRKVLSPVEAYNKFIRKEGEKVLTEEEYDKMIKDANN